MATQDAPSTYSSPFLMSATFMLCMLVPDTTILLTCVVSSSPWLLAMKIDSVLTPVNFGALQIRRTVQQCPLL